MNRRRILLTDRFEAGQLLAPEINKYVPGGELVVLGIPRGGVIVAAEIARLIGGKVDVIIARKLRVPWQPELAFGALSENGVTVFNQSVVGTSGLTRSMVEKEITEQTRVIDNQKALFRRGRNRTVLTGKTVIVTDDGIATGATFKAALTAVDTEKPAVVIAALPVGSENTVLSLETLADYVICFNCPPGFEAVSQYYVDFSEVSSEEVIAKLATG